MKPRISMITLGVKDLKRSIAFYEALGFHRQNDDEGVAFFDLNGSWLGLYDYNALAEDAQVAPDSGAFSGFTLAHNLSSEAEVDAVFAHALSVGAVATKHPQKVFWGGYSGYFQDPDGYLWEIAYNPFLWIGMRD
ncbi:MAG: glyoxalase [Sulfuricurvum sp. PC08-66]|nr:MAG: glyoxalase [Sulfuricurvum sp. PC08-66]